MAREIPLTRGQVALVDDCDFDRVSAFSWFAKPAQQTDVKFYAARSARKGEEGTFIYLHRFIVLAPAHLLVDHISGDTLDCRRANLRLCTGRQNSINRAYENLTGFRGVERTPGGFRVQFESEGVVFRLSALPTAETAARAYDALAREFHGEFAVLNFPKRSAA